MATSRPARTVDEGFYLRLNNAPSATQCRDPRSRTTKKRLPPAHAQSQIEQSQIPIFSPCSGRTVPAACQMPLGEVAFQTFRHWLRLRCSAADWSQAVGLRVGALKRRGGMWYT